MAVFLIGAVLVAGVVHLGVPGLASAGMDPMAAWLALSVPYVFLPVVAGGLWILRHERIATSLPDRLWLRRPSRKDWLWGLAGVLGISLGSGAMLYLCKAAGLEHNPPFARSVQPLTGDRAWLIALWAFNWPINILGEAFVWRAVILPRMRATFGSLAWLLNGALWGAFHLGFGPGNLLVLLPTLLLVPLITQWRRNTLVGAMMHAALSGPGFVALALGKV